MAIGQYGDIGVACYIEISEFFKNSEILSL